MESIDLHALWDGGKRLILLDVDNTLVQWKQENFSEEVLAWLAKAKGLGFELCILSNTRRVTRLHRIKERLGVEVVRGRFKPSRKMYRLALMKFNKSPHQAIMIGDQMLTDVLGANRSGIDAIWVKQIHHKEFGPTAINRFIERMLTSVIYKVLVLPETMHPAGASPTLAAEVTLVEQVVRFGIVGGSSFIIDYGLTSLLMGLFGASLGSFLIHSVPLLFSWATAPAKAAAPILGGMASFVAMFNSFVWNRAWTFEAHGKGRRSTQMVRFYLVSIAGACLNAGLFSVFFSLLPGNQMLLSKALAALIIAIWNFLGQRYFAFKPRSK